MEALNQATELLKGRYYKEWLASGPEVWPKLHWKLEMLADLKAELKKLMQRSIDNARGGSAESG